MSLFFGFSSIRFALIWLPPSSVTPPAPAPHAVIPSDRTSAARRADSGLDGVCVLIWVPRSSMSLGLCDSTGYADPAPVLRGVSMMRHARDCGYGSAVNRGSLVARGRARETRRLLAAANYLAVGQIYLVDN